MNAPLRQGYARCREVTRRHARSFYFASVVLFGARRRAAFALYAFCRRLDDLVDGDAEPGALAHRLAGARQVVRSVHEGRVPDATGLAWPTQELAALSDTVERFDLPERPFQELIRGMEMDLFGHRYRTTADLELYCDRVAGTVGRMIAPVLGGSDARALEPATALGVAMQLTNILRDVGEDLDRGRLYLPEDELARFDLTPTDVQARRVDERFKAFMRWQVDRARSRYAEAARGVPFLRALGAQRMVRLMGAIYGGILEDIERRGYDVFSGRAHVGTGQKLWRLAQVLVAPGRVLPEAAALSAGGVA